MSTDKPKRQKSKAAKWPRLYKRSYPSGQAGYVVDLGLVNGKRDRQTFTTREEAETHAERARIQKQNEGLAAFTLPKEVRVDAAKATEILKPHGASLVEAANYYLKHVIAFRSAPTVSEIVLKMLKDAEDNGRRNRTIGDLRHRLQLFADDFGTAKLSEISLEDIKDWLGEHEWAAQTRINAITKISQLFNYGIRHDWVEFNLAERIDRPDAEDKEPGIFTVEQAKTLLSKAAEFELLPYVSIGLFAGLRAAELMRLNGAAIRLDDRSIIVGAEVAKKRSRRVVEMADALVVWLTPLLPIKGPVVELSGFRDSFDQLRAAAKLTEWPHNGLRHSFGSYHLAFHGDAVKTAMQMGHRDSNVIHNHYKALVLKTEAERFWALRPECQHESE
jgi:integrase